MKCRVAWTACLLVFAPLEISAEPASVPLAAQAIASIRVDGNLSDWQGLKSTDAYQLPGNENLSGTLKILADQDALYFAIEIQDDKVIFGEEIFGASHLDDSVELHFGTNGDHVRISGDAEGRNPTIEGDFVFDSKVIQIPFLWEVLGVTAGIEKRSRGYSVEIRIPRDLLNAQEQVLLNLLVNDDDATGNIRTVNFFTVESMPFNIPQYSVNRVFPERIDVTKVGAKEFELTIGEARGYDFIHEVLAIVHMGDLQTIDVKLTQITKKSAAQSKKCGYFMHRVTSRKRWGNMPTLFT